MGYATSSAVAGQGNSPDGMGSVPAAAGLRAARAWDSSEGWAMGRLSLAASMHAASPCAASGQAEGIV